MTSQTATAEPTSSTVAGENETEGDDTIVSREPHNIFALAAYHVCMRTAWIFKTETVVMPAFLDAIAGQGWIRGWLPVLNRLGQSLPPLLASEYLKRSRIKSRLLLVTTALMAVPFFILAAVWYARGSNPPGWLPILFLAAYAFFFAMTGISGLVFSTVQGKLIRVNRRGRLMSIAGIVGSIVAVLAAWNLLGYWLSMPNNAGFTWVFLFTATGFVVATLSLLLIKEPPDEHQPKAHLRVNIFQETFRVFAGDARFRITASSAMLMMTALLLFPHYQWLGLKKLECGSNDLMIWVVVQNAAVGVFSLFVGWIADARGNRLAIRTQVFLIGFIPLLALWLSTCPKEFGSRWFFLTYIALGLCPVVIKTYMNYTLELTDVINHPRYVSTMSVCMALPFVFSPLVGWLVDVYYPAVFIGISLLVTSGGIVTFFMDEPRHQPDGILGDDLSAD